MLQEQLLRELCIEELENVYSGVLKRRSVLLQLKKDILFNHSAQINPIMPRPLLAAPLLFCTAVDLVIRIKYKKRVQVVIVNILWSRPLIFELSQDDAKNLWNLRNSLSHQYSSFNFLIISADGEILLAVGLAVQ
ncbi:hypothetical protein IPG36_00565 [bacterium]|nr:MAG: hypothetical protein IPG36_00565 [bacterium]